MAGRKFADWGVSRAPENVDRIMVGLCALIWLVLLGVSVAAVVALVDLGRGFHELTRNPHTGLLYVIIGVSALIIVAAVPVLLRANRAASQSPSASRPTGFSALQQAPSAETVDTAFDATVDEPPAKNTPGRVAATIWPNNDEVERIWLRGTVELVSVIGTALIAVAVATYLMAVGHDTAAWAGYGAAALVTVAIPVVVWRHLRRLGSVVAQHRAAN